MNSVLDKDLTGLEHMSAEQIRLILDTAEPFKEVSERPIKKVPALRGKTIVNLFFEASTRTRSSFEVAATALGATVLSFQKEASSVAKGESLEDTVRKVIELFVPRHAEFAAVDAKRVGRLTGIRDVEDVRRPAQDKRPRLVGARNQPDGVLARLDVHARRQLDCVVPLERGDLVGQRGVGGDLSHGAEV